MLGFRVYTPKSVTTVAMAEIIGPSHRRALRSCSRTGDGLGTTSNFLSAGGNFVVSAGTPAFLAA